jgi:hypothetical protein
MLYGIVAGLAYVVPERYPDTRIKHLPNTGKLLPQI